MTAQTNAPITLYWDTLSGHAHRARLLLSLMNLPYEIRQIDLRKAQHKQPDYLAINPLGQLPAIVDNGVTVFDSNAILTYLAIKYDAARTWFPTDAVQAAAVVRFLSFAAGPVYFGAATARVANVFGVKADLAQTQAIADKYFPGLEQHLTGRRFLVGITPTIADVANYTYIAHAPEGGISLEPYPNIRAWLANIEALPGFIAMQRSAAGLHAAA